MLHALPITNVRLLACHEDWQRMTPTEQGRHCQSCQREVVDFTQASAAELAAARAASPDGRLCGHFRRGQLAGGRPVRFGLWARAFVLALALVFGQGLTARQAWAQVCGQRPPFKAAASLPQRYGLPGSWPMQADFRPPRLAAENWVDVSSGLVAEPVPVPTGPSVYISVEQMPQPPGGLAAFTRYLQQQAHYPASTTEEGKVFVAFTVRADGHLTDFDVIKGITPALDAEALRLLHLRPIWTPGRNGNQPVAVRYTIPVTFARPR